MKICIYSQQKTGSTSLHYIFKNNNLDFDKRHYNFNAIRDIYYDIIIIPIRKIKDIIISGYFENILTMFYKKNKTIKNYKDILKIPIKEHINNIKSYNWNKDNCFTIKGIEVTLDKIFYIKLNTIKFKKSKKYKLINSYNIFQKKYTKILICDFINMNIEEKEEMFKLINLNLKKIDLHINIGKQKWYKDLYIQTKKELKNNKFENLYDISFY